MSSLVPQIKIGLDLAFRGRNVSCMTHGTSEIGYVYPTYCRRYTANAKVSIAPRTGVRFSPLFVPTMGKLDVRHYFDFVPFNRVYAPFDAFLAQEPYNFESSSQVPAKLPYFKMNEIIHYYLRYYYSSYTTWSGLVDATDSNSMCRKNLTCCFYKKDGSSVVPVIVDQHTDLDWWRAFFWACDVYESGEKALEDYIVPGLIVNRTNNGNSYLFPYVNDEDAVTLMPVTDFNVDVVLENQDDKYKEFVRNLSFPTYSHCDWLYQFNYDGETYYACFNYNGVIKRLRSLFQGLGYSFNIYDTDGDIVLPLHH